MSPIFYRYIRPTRFVERRTEIETLPHGGICLRFEPDQSETLTFSFSRCRNDELFSKTVAKQIADRRAVYFKEAGFKGGIKFSRNTDELVYDVIEACNDFKVPNSPSPIHYYLHAELQDFSAALKALTVSNQQVEHTAKIWSEGIKAANFKEQYENH